jgi:hypothetical protein
MTETRRRLPNSAALTDDPADLSTSRFTPMGPDGIISELVNASGDPQAGTLVPRYGTEGLCETCLGRPDRATQAGHPYVAVLSRVPGVHPAADDGRVHNFDPAIDSPGDSTMVVDDLEINSGRASTRFSQANSRWRETSWPPVG